MAQYEASLNELSSISHPLKTLILPYLLVQYYETVDFMLITGKGMKSIKCGIVILYEEVSIIQNIDFSYKVLI